ncbi:MAG TPA: sigma 54-interacting transcriptional regulator [Kofleriaceae bacterium]|jgi:DNA-binding NtrC family response regulator|nr:sigma 54-interacting transcriptional regulator [Kofleriaceae bacterium]
MSADSNASTYRPDDSAMSRLDSSTHDSVENAYLLVFQGASSRAENLPLDGDIVIGRADGAQVRLLDKSVSRAHARISMHGGRAEILDLGSQNGTKVNGERIVGARPLLSGDVITILSVTLVFHSSAPAPSRRKLLALDGFRQRLEDEIDRLARNRRSFGLVAIALVPPDSDALPRVFDPIALAQVVEPALRRIDVIALTGAELLVLMPEIDVAAAQQITIELLALVRVDAPRACGGIALAPADGNDFEILLSGARSARSGAGPGKVGLAAETYRLIEIGGNDLIVADPAMLRVTALLERLSKADLSVLVCGETGTGKELAATVLHQWSARAARPLVVLNCAALPESLAESELFGHEKGAFTGAVAQKIGILEQSDGGTVFLDEIGELSLTIQAKVLRALETKRITRVGGQGEHPINLRIVAATNRDLAEEVEAGRFRQDLLFRIGGATVWLPPLRDRRREIPILAQRFLADACRRAGRDAMEISTEALQLLLDSPWPGNVRELRHVMEYVAAAHDEPIVAAWHLVERLGGEGRPRRSRPVTVTMPVAVGAPPGGFAPIEDEIRELERTRMSQALAAADGNQTAAAELIKMPLRTFQAKAKVYGLRPKDRR